MKRTIAIAALVMVVVGMIPAMAVPNDKVTICHVPNGNPAQATTLTISKEAAQKHLEEHSGDSLGPCTKPIAPVPELSPIILTSSGLAGLLLVSKFKRN